MQQIARAQAPFASVFQIGGGNVQGFLVKFSAHERDVAEIGGSLDRNGTNPTHGIEHDIPGFDVGVPARRKEMPKESGRNISRLHRNT